MDTPQTHAFGNPAINLIAAVFLNDTAASDAVADLRLAGFQASDIGVAFYDDSVRGRSGTAHGPHDLEKEHSIFWRVRHGVSHDLQSHGADFSAQQDADQIRQRPAYTDIDRVETLRSRGIPEDTIQLLGREVGPHGSLILVMPHGREDEVRFILERNGGYLRTAMATELPPARR